MNIEILQCKYQISKLSPYTKQDELGNWNEVMPKHYFNQLWFKLMKPKHKKVVNNTILRREKEIKEKNHKNTNEKHGSKCWRNILRSSRNKHKMKHMEEVEHTPQQDTRRVSRIPRHCDDQLIEIFYNAIKYKVIVR